jgi:hypothetical protein
MAPKLMQGGSIPQLIMYRHTDGGWAREQLTGAQGVAETQLFLSRGTQQPSERTASR